MATNGQDFKCSGIAVVDKHNRIVANFSASDLIGLNEDNFHLLQLPVKEYLTRVYGFPKVLRIYDSNNLSATCVRVRTKHRGGSASKNNSARCS